jgi:hypothetical protein
MVSADLLYPTPSTSSAMKTPENAKEDLNKQIEISK